MLLHIAGSKKVISISHQIYQNCYNFDEFASSLLFLYFWFSFLFFSVIKIEWFM